MANEHQQAEPLSSEIITRIITGELRAVGEAYIPSPGAWFDPQPDSYTIIFTR